MRRSLLLLGAALAVALAAPGASAQDAFPPPVIVEVDGFPGPVAPVNVVRRANVTLDVACEAIFDPGPPPRTVPMEIQVEGPSWATLTVVPSTLLLANDCTPGSRIREVVELVASVTSNAPAFHPAAVTVTASVTSPIGRSSGAANSTVEADYFVILDSAVDESVRVAEPGDEVPFTVTVGNLGNGETRVTFHVVDVPEGWSVMIPEPTDLGSRQTGSATTTAVLEVVVATAPGGAFTNRPGLVGIRVDGSYAHGPADAAGSAMHTLLITAKGPAAAATPGPGGALLAVAVAVAVGAARILGGRRSP